MKIRLSCAFAALAALALPASSWAQQQDLEVTIGVVSGNALPDAVTKQIKLPDTASGQAQDSSAFGLGVANKAREMRGDLGRDFGQEVSEAAKDRAQSRGNGKP